MKLGNLRMQLENLEKQIERLKAEIKDAEQADRRDRDLIGDYLIEIVCLECDGGNDDDDDDGTGGCRTCRGSGSVPALPSRVGSNVIAAFKRVYG